MTDQEKLVALLTGFDVGFEESDDTVTCYEGDNGVSGYSCFYTRFEFDATGKFEQMGAYE